MNYYKPPPGLKQRPEQHLIVLLRNLFANNVQELSHTPPQEGTNGGIYILVATPEGTVLQITVQSGDAAEYERIMELRARNPLPFRKHATAEAPDSP